MSRNGSGMLRRKIYDSYDDQKRDQRIGFILFPVVTVILWITITTLRSRISSLDLSPETAQLKVILSWLPWVVNALLIAVILVFRWSVGTGYLISMAGLGIVGTGLFLISVSVSFMSIPLMAIAGELGFFIFVAVLLGGYLWFVWGMFKLLRKWWAV